MSVPAVPDRVEPEPGESGHEPVGRTLSHPPLRVRRGAARSTTWWGRAWVRAVEEAAYAEGDLKVARALARTAAVGGISLAPGRLVAAVADSRGLWTVDARMPVLEPDALAALVETVAAEVGRVAALLAGDLPHTLVEHAEETGVELLPFGGELETSCSCTAWVDPCPHALAVLYQAAWLLDADPLLLVHLRGLPREELLARLHRHESGRRGGDEEEVEATLDTAADAAARAARLLHRLASADPDDDVAMSDLL